MRNNSKTKNVCFVNRQDKQYLEVLSRCLDLDYLIETALTIKDTNFEKLIQIDFAGIAGTTILFGTTPKAKEIQEKFENVLKNTAVFADKKIKLRIRFLFMYLYSDFSYAQIEAELTPNRATIENTQFSLDDDLYNLSPNDFFSSDTYKNQRHALDQLQTYYNKYFKHSKSPCNIRFVCLPLNFCMLNVNNKIFIDPYTYAQETHRSKLNHNTPVTSISKMTSKQASEIIEDHFRYMWGHPTTLFSQDATEWKIEKNSKKLRGLSDVKPPQNVTFEKKAKVLMDHLKQKNGNDKNSVNIWRFRVERMFYYMTRIMENQTNVEAIFIGFSFANGERLADYARRWLEVDFNGCLNVNVVDMSTAKDVLHKELMNKLKDSTMGLFFLNKDIEEVSGKDENIHKNYYSRPNIHFEIGFLMSHVAKFGGNSNERIILLTEPGLDTPTDFQDFKRFPMKGKIIIDYIDIMSRIIAVNKTLTRDVADQAVINHCNRLEKSYLGKGGIVDSDLKNYEDFQSYLDSVNNKLSMEIEARFPSEEKN